MILVTGAAGKTGQAVIRALAQRKRPVRALVFRPQQTRVVTELGVSEAVTGDMRDRTVLGRAMQNVRAVYHICPNMSPDEVSIARAIITAASSAGVEQFIYHSVLHPQTEDMPHHWLKLRVEEQLFQSGLAYTILQPAAYMQNVLAHWDRIVECGLYPVPYPAATRLSMVDLQDVAAAAAIVLTEPGHVGATYELCGPGVLSQTETAGILSQQLGRDVVAREVPLFEWERQARDSGLGDYQVATLIKMFRYYERHGFWGNPRVLGWLLGRPPTSFAAFLEREARDRMPPGQDPGSGR
jgi:uncharacterized protein YbjT (DUF2867 family)